MEINAPLITYASLNKRIIAAAIDLFILLIIITPIMNIISDLILDKDVSVTLNELSKQNGENLVSAEMIINKLSEENFFQKYLILQFITFCFISLYLICFWAFTGTTIGKWACACKIVDAKSLFQLSFKQVIWRWLGCVISSIPFGFGFIMIAFTHDKKGLHDKIAATAVINFKHDFTWFEKLRNKLLRK